MAKKKTRPGLLDALSGASVPKAKKVTKKAVAQKDKEDEAPMRQLSLMVPHDLWQRLQAEHNRKVMELAPGEKKPQLRELVWELLDMSLPDK